MLAPPRFLTLNDLAPDLNISDSQAYALVRDPRRRAPRIGRRGHWRVERADLMAYADQAETETDQWNTEHLCSGSEEDE